MNQDIILRTLNRAWLEGYAQEEKYCLVKLSKLLKYSVIFFAYRNKDYRSYVKKQSVAISHYRRTKFGKVVSFNTASGLLTVSSYKNSSRNVFNTLTSNMKFRYVEPEDVIIQSSFSPPAK